MVEKRERALAEGSIELLQRLVAQVLAAELGLYELACNNHKNKCNTGRIGAMKKMFSSRCQGFLDKATSDNSSRAQPFILASVVLRLITIILSLAFVSSINLSISGTQATSAVAVWFFWLLFNAATILIQAMPSVRRSTLNLYPESESQAKLGFAISRGSNGQAIEMISAQEMPNPLAEVSQ